MFKFLESEKKRKDLSPQGKSRRDCLSKILKITGLGLLATSPFDAQLAINFLTFVHKGSGPPLIDNQRGLAPKLTSEITRSASLTQTTADFSGHIVENAEKKEIPLLGDEVKFAIDHAASRLYPGTSIRITDRQKRMEIVFNGSASYAAPTSTWYDGENLILLGFPREMVERAGRNQEGTKHLFWGENGLGRYFSNILAMDGGPDLIDRAPTAGGQDGPLHFGTHLFLTFSYLHSLHFASEDYTRIPLVARGLVRLGKIFGGISSDIDEAVFVSQVAGKLYEVSNLIGKSKIKDLCILGQKFENLPWVGNMPIGETEFTGLRFENWPFLGNVPSEGPFDPTVEGDYGSNRLGAAAAAAFWRKIWTEEPFEVIYDILNDKRIQKYPEGLGLIDELNRC